MPANINWQSLVRICEINTIWLSIACLQIADDRKSEIQPVGF